MEIPVTTKAILWDMDGVLIDSLGLDLVVCNKLLKKYFGDAVEVSRSYIQSIFAYSVPEFWKMILEKVLRELSLPDAMEKYQNIIEEYERVRQAYPFQLCPGVKRVLDDARSRGLVQAVVSNNPTAQVREILSNVEIEDDFAIVVGNDVSVEQKELRKKPAPDTYLFAAAKVGIPSAQCVVVEDSIMGAEAGKAAGCFVVGVATGGATVDELKNLGNKVDRVYQSFT